MKMEKKSSVSVVIVISCLHRCIMLLKKEFRMINLLFIRVHTFKLMISFFFQPSMSTSFVSIVSSERMCSASKAYKK